MTTGSHQQQAYWYRTGHSRVLGQLPAMYLIGDQRWIPRPAAFMRPPSDGVFSETGRWNGVCINCHATHGKWLFGDGDSVEPERGAIRRNDDRGVWDRVRSVSWAGQRAHSRQS